MNKLKEVIAEYSHWDVLSVYIDRIESHFAIDFSHSLENAKALLESVGKEICDKNGRELAENSSINGVLKNAFSSMGYSNSNFVSQVSASLATIAQQIGNLRNEIGLTSHGKSLEDIKSRNSKVDILTREFLINTVESISVLLIRTFETQQKRTDKELLVDTLDYWEAEEFNESWDDSFGEFVMGDYSYLASEILFNVDKQAYVTEYKTFTEAEEE